VVIALREDGASDGAFTSMLREVVDDMCERFAIRVELTILQEPPPLPARMQAELLRIVHESLANVRRHAMALRVFVRLCIQDGMLRLEIEDDGRGFDVGGVERSSVGILSMHERAAAIGAELAIESVAGRGTLVRVSAPLAPATAAAP
jgi:signal transduction histidine kinase